MHIIFNDHFAAQLLYEITNENQDDNGAAERLAQHLGYGSVTHGTTLLDNCIDYLTTLRDEGDDDEIAIMDDGAIQREANRMANVLVNARAAFMTHDLDTTPEVE